MTAVSPTKMQDPHPANIEGNKIQKHVFTHEINWSHAAIAVAAIYATYKFGQWVSDSSGESEAEESDEFSVSPGDMQEIALE